LAQAEVPQSAFQMPEIVAVENRKFDARHELQPALALLPLDAFTKSITFGGSYTYYLKNFLAWEVANLAITKNFDTGLRTKISDLGGDVDGELQSADWLLTSGVSWSPLYNKSLLMNSRLVHSDTTLQAGGGAVSFNQGAAQTWLVYIGASQRFFLNETWGLRLTLRHHLGGSVSGSMTQILSMGVGLSYSFGNSTQ
jgi:outer membrane beta-barrel protein